MRRPPPLLRTGLALAAAACGLLLSACGEKIVIPQPEGLFSVSQYIDYGAWSDNDPRQLVTTQGSLFVISADGLTKRNLEFSPLGQVGGLADPRAICASGNDTWVFVWEQGAGQVSWFRRDDLTQGGATPLDGPLGVTAMVTSPAGIEEVPGALTFLYLSDPAAGVIWRYAFDEFNGLTAYGLLARADGDAARFVHIPAGLARDWDNRLLACDPDTLRNWVIRFDATPDETDPDLRGLAATFLDFPVCSPEPAADEYVLGNAAGCGQTDWAGGTSSQLGYFNAPQAAATDGLGRIFVADTGNDRVQIFDRHGVYSFSFGTSERTPRPVSIDLVDVRIGGGANDYSYGAWLFLVTADTGEVRRYISNGYYTELNRKPPPPPD